MCPLCYRHRILSSLSIPQNRTQKLSTFTATIVGLAPAKIASCRVLFLYICSVCLLFFYAFLAYNTNMHKILKYCKSKPIYIILAVLLQFLTLFFLVSYFSQRFFIVYYILIIFSLCVCMHIINRDSDSSSKLLWVLLIMSFPIFGGIVYLLLGNRKIPKALMIKDRQAYSD